MQLKRRHIISIIILMIFLLFVGAATAASIGSTTVTNTNVYAGSNQYDIAPSDYYDSSSIAFGMTHVSGRFIYAEGLSVSPNPATLNQNVIITTINQQGAAVSQGTTKATPAYEYTYETGATGTEPTYTYSTTGSKTPSLHLSNPAGVHTVTTTIDVRGVSITDCTVTNTNVYAGSNQYDLAPPDYIDSSSTATGITHISNRYVYVTGLTATPDQTSMYGVVTYTVHGQQGASVIESTNKAELGHVFTYETGVTGKAFTHVYLSDGIKQPSVKLTNPADTTGAAASTTVTISGGGNTPQTVTTRVSTIQAKTSDNYQALQEFDFDSGATIHAVEWLSNDHGYIAAGNAVYEVSGSTAEIKPVSNWTGATISKAYLGNTKAIINDINNNVTTYTYANHERRLITTSGSNVLAVTDNYAAVLQSGSLNIYDKYGIKKATVTSSATSLQANDKTDIFAYYNGRTVYYYTISGTTATQHTATPIPENYVITSLKQIRGTENWLITTDHQTAGTGEPKVYVVKIAESGITTVLTSNDPLRLSHAQATESNSIIGTDRSTAYFVGADGIIQGTYTTGGTLNDASIAKSNGLYAITGGQDNQAYFLNKYESSNWILGQAVDFFETVNYAQISNDGTYALVGTANKFFLFKWEESVDSQYFINGVVVGSDGLPYANKYISIDANSVQTDDSGFFVYPVKPGQTYTIVTGSKTTRYTATNQALQTLSIKIQSQLIAQDVTYGVTYNSNTGNIEMHYNDAVDKTSIVVWKVRDTKTGQTVYQESMQAGQEALYFVPQDKQSENYFVSVEAERGDTTVKNTWSITPSGQGQFVNLFGMDDTGKNILFGFFLILLAGLFGYLHQHIGTIIIAFAAAVLRYLGLITVPWIMILIAVVVSIVAAIAHKGEGR